MTASADEGAHRTVRRRRTYERTQGDVRAAARAVLVRGGLAAVTLRAVGAELGMAPSGVYRYYESRDDLLGALQGEFSEELLACLERARAEVPPDADPTDAPRRLCHALRRWALDHREEFLLMVAVPSPRAPVRHLGDGQASTRQRFIMSLLASLGPMLRAGQVRTRPVPPGATDELSVYAALLADGLAADGQLPLPSPPAPGQLVTLLHAWGRLLGHVALESLGQLPLPTADRDDWFAADVEEIVAGIRP